MTAKKRSAVRVNLGVFRARRRSAAAICGVVFVVIVATLSTSSASDINGSGQTLTLYAETNDAGALIQGNDVRMYGVKIGVVKKLEVVRNDTAKLTLDLTTTETPIHTDAKLRIRPVSLLGERYVELDPGTPSAPVIEEGYTLPADHVSRAVDLDEVLNTVDDPTGTALSMLVKTLGEGIQGNGDNVADTVTNLAPSMSQANQLVAVLDDQTATLQRLIDALDPVMASIGTNDGTSVDSLIDSAGTLLTATAEQQAALRSTLDELPSTLATAEETLARLSGLADEATPALASARPFTDKLDDISHEVIDFSNAAGPAIATLKPVLSKARELVQQATPLVAQLNSSRDAMVADAANGARFLNDLSDHLGGLLDFITYWSLTTNGRDGLSHYFRVQVIVNSDTVTSLDPTGTLGGGGGGGLPSLPPKTPGIHLPGVDLPGVDLPGVDLPNVELPGLGINGDSGLHLPGLGGRNGLGLQKQRNLAQDNHDTATGLTVEQESDLLDMLMGDAS